MELLLPLLGSLVPLAGARVPHDDGREVLWDPPAVRVAPDHERCASDPTLVPGMLADGKALFLARFNVLDGAGRPGATGDSKPTPRLARGTDFHRISGPDANSCSGCHNQPVLGGSGDSAGNVFVGAHFAPVPLEAISPEQTSERGTPGMFGAGAVEMLARQMTTDLREMREGARALAVGSGSEVLLELEAAGIPFGVLVARPDGTCDQSRVEGVDHDLVVRPFGVKGIACSLREFTIAALNQHHGIQAVERFGWERTGRLDFDEDGIEVEATLGQVSALVLFQATLPPPPRPRGDCMDEQWQLGARLFSVARCDRCHVPSLTLDSDTFSEPNPYNRPGTLSPTDASTIEVPLPRGPELAVERDGNSLRVWLYSDLRRHVITDPEHPHFGNERRRQDNVPCDQFMTPRLWDLARSAPYGHRGDCSTVSEAILHHGGEAAASRRAFEDMSDAEKRALVVFLLSLGSEEKAPVSH